MNGLLGANRNVFLRLISLFDYIDENKLKQVCKWHSSIFSSTFIYSFTFYSFALTLCFSYVMKYVGISSESVKWVNHFHFVDFRELGIYMYKYIDLFSHNFLPFVSFPFVFQTTNILIFFSSHPPSPFSFFFFFLLAFENVSLEDLVVPNGGFTLEGKRGIFGCDYHDGTLVFQRGTADGVMDMFVLCICCCKFIFLLPLFFLALDGVLRDAYKYFLPSHVSFFFGSKVKYERPQRLFIFFFYFYFCIVISTIVN
jgi:hypothetical protein